MTSSVTERFVNLRSTAGDSAEPVSAGESFTAANNLAHLADQAAQVRVNWQGSLQLPTTAIDGQGTTGVTYDSDIAYALWHAEGLMLHERVSGAYGLRLDVAARSPTGKTITIDAQITPPGWTTITGYVGAPYEARFTTSSSTAAWLGMTTLELEGEFGLWNRIYGQPVGTIRELGGPNAGTTAIRCNLVLKVQGISAGNDVELNGVYLAEFHG